MVALSTLIVEVSEILTPLAVAVAVAVANPILTPVTSALLSMEAIELSELFQCTARWFVTFKYSP